MTKNLVIPKRGNPLLLQDYDLVETRLVEAYAREVEKHHAEINPNDEGLWVALSLDEVVKSNHYHTVRDANERLKSRKLVSIVKDWDGDESYIGKYRMGKGDAILFANIPLLMIEHYLELAALPYMPYAIRFRSEHDRPLYLLNYVNEQLADRSVPQEVALMNGERIMIYPSPAKGRDWGHVLISDLVKLLGLSKESYFYQGGDWDFGMIKKRILSPRFNHLSTVTDLHCEVSNKQGPVKVTGIDIRSTRQAGNVSSTGFSGFSEYQLWDKKSLIRDEENLIAFDLLFCAKV